MKNPKSKFQAQRKFAQGYLPSSSGAGTAQVTPRADPPPATPHQHQSAATPNHSAAPSQQRLKITHLLDILSFQNVHVHSDPVVVLERLAPTIEKAIHESLLDRRAASPTFLHTAGSILSKTSMCLRSRNKPVRRKFSVRHRAIRHKRKRHAMPTTTTTTSQACSTTPEPFNLANMRTQRSCSTTSEEEVPLLYFQVQKNSLSEESLQVADKQEEPETSRPEENGQPQTARSAGVRTRRKAQSFQIPARSAGIRKRRKTQLFQIPEPTKKRRRSAPVAPLGETADDAQTFKEPAIPERARRYIMQSPNAETDNTAATADARTATAPENAFAAFELSECGSSRAGSPCPSESIRTIRDVLEATPSLRSRRCNHCICCDRVNKLEKVVEAMHNAYKKKKRSKDVYEFSDQDESSNPPSNFRPRRRRHSLHTATQSSDEDSDKEPVFFDLFKDSDFIIQLLENPNTTSKNKMRAEVVPKSRVQAAKDYSMVEHEDVLNELAESAVLALEKNKRNEGAGPSARPKKTPKGKSGEGRLLDAPVYKPTEAEFKDPIAYFERIAPIAAKYGIAKVVAPKSFKPVCNMGDSNMKLNCSNHYIARLYRRWGTSAREMSAIKAYLATHNITFQRVPVLEGLEVNLAKLHAVVQRNGGLKEVMEKKLWGRVADEMNFGKAPNIEKSVDNYYVKYLLPYDTAEKQEQQDIVAAVDRIWYKKYRKLVAWARNPLHHQKKMLGESDSSDDEDSEEEQQSLVTAMKEAEDCISPGRSFALKFFKRVAQRAMLMYMGCENATPEQVEETYWQFVLFGLEHVCVNAASVNTYGNGYGFTCNTAEPSHTHPWNLKNFSHHKGNVLGSLGPVGGVTVPTLHFGMVFATSCWHRDPHGLPWIEYMHEGAPKIWYGIPEEQSVNFRNAVDELCPTSCQKKAIWLSSDITMIPPHLLREHHVSLSRVVQKPGEYIIVFPKAYSCSISTGYTVSESVYFATHSWLNNVHQDFQELRASCEPTAFPIEKLLLNLAKDTKLTTAVLQQVWTELNIIIRDEINNREALFNMGVKRQYKPRQTEDGAGVVNVGEYEECAICRASLYLSKVTGLITKKKDFVCVGHAVQLLQKRGAISAAELATIEMVIFHSQDDLQCVLKSLKTRIIPSTRA